MDVERQRGLVCGAVGGEESGLFERVDAGDAPEIGDPSEGFAVSYGRQVKYRVWHM